MREALKVGFRTPSCY